jgi:hypothetical protein
MRGLCVGAAFIGKMRNAYKTQTENLFGQSSVAKSIITKSDFKEVKIMVNVVPVLN